MNEPWLEIHLHMNVVTPIKATGITYNIQYRLLLEIRG